MGSKKRGSPTKLTSELQPLPPVQMQAPSQPRAATATVACQTTAWNVLVAEAVASERTRSQALQAELKALRAQMEDREEAARAADAAAAESAEAHGTLALELHAARRSLDEARAFHEKEKEAWEEERRSWQEERARLKREADLAGSSERRGVEDIEHLRSELKRSKDEAAALRKKLGALQQDMQSLTTEKNALAKEKDSLLERLEQEQAEMMARVEALDRRIAERPVKAR